MVGLQRSRAFASALLPPLAARGDEPSQVQCRTFTKDEPVKNISVGNEKHPAYAECFSFGIRQRPTLPGRLQPSTIGAERLNFCVRYGNRWIPFAIVTGIYSGFSYPENRTSRSLHLVKNQSLTSIFPLVSLDSQFLRSSPRPISIIKLHMLPYFHR